MLRLVVLGPLRLYRAGQPVPLALRKTRALLALLALDGPRPRAWLAERLWPNLDEAAARRNLRRELARLREAGVGEAVASDGEQLRLAADLGSDWAEAQQALRAGDADAALAAFGAPLLGEIDADDAPTLQHWLHEQRGRLGDWRRTALAAAATAHERAGRWEPALARTEQLLAEEALQERHHLSAMRLLAALGRREAALAQYERCRALLRDELDLQPMQAMQDLAQQLRAQSAQRVHAGLPAVTGFEPAPPEPRSEPAFGHQPVQLPPLLPLVGRSAEIATMEEAWNADVPLMLSGPGGIGKSRLAVDFAQAHGPFARVPARPGDAGLPYAALTRALRILAGSADDAAAASSALPAWAVPELARLMPELGPAPAPMASDEERGRFVEACAQAWNTWAGDSFDALVLDDWHWADTASLQLLAHLARRRREAGRNGPRELLLLRPDELAPPQHDALRAMGARGIELAPLPVDAVLDLVAQLAAALDAPPRRFAARLHRATGGNPFFLGQTLAHLAAHGLLQADPQGQWHTPFDAETADYAELPLPASVFEALRERAARLPEPARRLLEVAALADEPFDAERLAPACALSPMEGLIAVEAALAAHLLREHERGGFAFVHDLVRQALAEPLPPPRRRLVHRRLALVAEAAQAPAAQVAAHLEAAGERRRASTWWQRAGDEARALLSLPQAADHWERALQCEPTPAEAHALRVRLLRALNLNEQDERAQPHATALLSAAQDSAQSGEQAAEGVLAVAAWHHGFARNREALALLETLAPPQAPHLRLRYWYTRAATLGDLGQVGAAREAFATALAHATGDATDDGDLLLAGARMLLPLGEFEQVRAWAGQAVQAFRRSGHAVGLLRARYLLALVEGQTGQPAAALAELQAVAQQAAGHGLVGLQRAVLFNCCWLYSARGEPREVLRCAREGLGLQPPLAHSGLRTRYQLALVDAAWALGEWGDAIAHARDVTEAALATPDVQTLADVATAALEPLALLGEAELAQRLIDALPPASAAAAPQPMVEALAVTAHVELAASRILSAQARLEVAQAHAHTTYERARHRLAIETAELRRRLGQLDHARQQLPAWNAAELNDEQRLRLLSVARRMDKAQARPQDALRLAEAPDAHAYAAWCLIRTWVDREPNDETWRSRLLALEARIGEPLRAQPKAAAAWQATVAASAAARGEG